MEPKPQRRRRPLYEWEKIEAQKVFDNSLNFERVRINEGVRWPDTFNIIGRRLKNLPPPGPTNHNAITLGYSCNFPVNLPVTNPAPGHHDEFFVNWLIHELTHCWQHQHTGPIYIVRALSAQFRLKDAAYDFGGAPNLLNVRSTGGNIFSFNPEAQAVIAQTYYLRLRKKLDVTAFESYIDDIRKVI